VSGRSDIPDISDEALDRVFRTEADEEHGGWVEALLPYSNFVIEGPPADGLRVAIALCDAAPDDDALCHLGVAVIEPLLDLHWKTIGDAFEAKARRNSALRKALSCALLDIRPSRAGRAVEQRFYALIRPDDDIGRQPSQ
jgi:hypothetical protein